MMNQIQMWQLIVDIGLITSVLTMTMRAFKSSRLPGMLPKTRELEASLRSLIGEAETAGLQLNDQLLRREQNIQRALAEIQQSEARIAKAVADAEALQEKLQTTRTETVRVIQDLKNGFERGVQTERARFEEQSAAPHQATPHVVQSEPAPTPQQTSTSHVAAQPSAFVEQTYSRTPLQRNVEVITTPEQGTTTQQGYMPAGKTAGVGGGASMNATELQRIYKAAEQMLKDGESIDHVSAQMKIPVEGVRLLAEMIEIEREEDSRGKQVAEARAASDSRLGALGAIRRQTSAL
jgi:hypothetical protein